MDKFPNERYVKRYVFYNGYRIQKTKICNRLQMKVP